MREAAQVQLERRYERRFACIGAYRLRVWSVLVRAFFQRRAVCETILALHDRYGISPPHLEGLRVSKAAAALAVVWETISARRLQAVRRRPCVF